MKYAYYLLLVFAFVAALYVLYGLLPEDYRAYMEIKAVQAAIALVVGVLFIEYLARMIMRYARKIGAEALLVRNVILVLGYIVLGVVVLVLVGVGGEPLIASATFSGLVVGLGMQPILANFFAGLIILGTGFLKPGKRVRIASTAIPVTTISFPAYKSFSRDTFIPTVKGTVVEVGLMYTKILLETGELIKVSNSMLFSSTVVFEEDELLELPRIQVRYEFPVDYDPGLVLENVKKALSNLADNVEVYI
ncbi:MAG: mechanosensitive ion channel family protein, partial [Desulfurococcaceae archaeon]